MNPAAEVDDLDDNVDSNFTGDCNLLGTVVSAPRTSVDSNNASALAVCTTA